MSEIKPFTGVDDRVRLADVVPLSTPFTLNIFPSNICNFKCCYCAQSLGSEVLQREYDLPPRNMPLEVMELVVRQAAEFPKPFKLVSFMGHGEPLCNQELPEMIRMVKAAGITERVDIITNASLLTPEYSDRLLEAGLDVLRVSLQGVSSDAYWETSRVKLDFEEFCQNLAYFYRRRGNCRLYVKVVDAALGQGEEDLFFERFASITDRMFIDRIKPVYSGVEYTENQRNLSVDRYGNVHDKRVVCPQPFYMLSVWANGDVAPCDALYKACPLGNVRESTLRTMWESERKREFCRLHLRGLRESDPACVKCCAPDDVQHEEDVLDYSRAELLKHFYQ